MSRIMAIMANEASIDLQGTLRSQSVECTLAWLQPKLVDMGITRVADVTGLDHIGIFATSCIRPNSKHLALSQGKGCSLALAKVSAMMEACEGYHMENPPPAQRYGSYRQLSENEALIHPNELPRTQFAAKDLTDEPLAWLAAKNLYDGKTYYIPHVFSHLNMATYDPAFAYFKVSTNGIAAGNVFDEAVCHALYEVIERDSLTRWQHTTPLQKKGVQVNLATVDGHCQAILAQYAEAGVGVKVWEVTSSIRLPAYQCAIFDKESVRSLGVFTGSGAHINRDIALSRALTEAAQSRLTLISGNRDDLYPDFYQRHKGSAQQVDEETMVGVKDFADCCQPVCGDAFKHHIDYVMEELKGAGLTHVLLVDYSKPQIGVPVVQVFIPGMQFNTMRM
jgi:YcaO-like protein with predicted kinase domain